MVDKIAVIAIIGLVTNIIIIEPKSKQIELIKLTTLLFKDCPIVSTSFVMRLNISPVELPSIYLSGSLLIFTEISFLNFLIYMFYQHNYHGIRQKTIKRKR